VLQVVFFSGIFLALTAEWTRDYRRLRWQARELEALHALIIAPVIEDVTAVVQHIILIVGETLQAKVRVLITGRDDVQSSDPLMAQVTHLDARTLQADDEEGARRMLVSFGEGAQGRVALAVPLRTSGRQFGILLAVRDGHDEFSTHDIRLLRAFGAQASVLLERSLLYEEVAAGAVVEERSRLAREIHDGLAQHLAFLKMRVAWLQRSASPIETSQLQDIQGGLETALTEARQAIMTLRTDIPGTSTADAIVYYAEEFGHVSGLEIEVTRAADAPDVGPKARLELLRVVQEALNNVRKHAQATRVLLKIENHNGGLAVTVQDNGAGFELDHSAAGHFGLDIMKERAESIGASFEVTSAVRAGTTVRISLPMPDGDGALTGQRSVRIG
jgi:two-component system nitrate/nitrite sensor histidine kinase NarX